MRALHLLFLTVFFALAALPLGERYAALSLPLPLRGAVEAPEPVALSRNTYLDGSFQTVFEQSFNAALGFRAALIRSDNELNFRAFHEFSPSPGTAMVLGKQGFIYERSYIDDYNRRNLVSSGQLEQQVLRLKSLQDYGKAHDIAVLLVISPSKALLYPEYLPKRFVYPERLTLPNNYGVFVELLKHHELDFLDVQAFASKWKRSSQFTLFANTGAHWNDLVACQATSQIINFIAERSRQPASELRCEPYVLHSEPRKVDRDLLDLANLWSEGELLRPTPYASARVVTRGNTQKPSVLFTGSSFLWQVLDYLGRFKIDHRDNFYYYYKANISYPSRRRIPLEPKQIDWQSDVFGKQAIVIEINASVVEHVGWGFLEDAERAIHDLN